MRLISIAVMLLLTCCAGEEPVTGAVAVEDEKAAIVRAHAVWQLINPDVDVGNESQWLTEAKASLSDGIWTVNRYGVTLSINKAKRPPCCRAGKFKLRHGRVRSWRVSVVPDHR